MCVLFLYITCAFLRLSVCLSVCLSGVCLSMLLLVFFVYLLPEMVNTDDYKRDGASLSGNEAYGKVRQNRS